MANFGRKKSLGEAPPAPTETLNNVEKPAGKWKDLNFKVDPDFQYEFTVLAAQHRISQVELLRRAYAAYVEKFGGPKL
ncbi:hypothetical protein [Magnetospirillum molischianum]|uniref:Uncharacterized protein n=1 Tax=Magnetospirillum molischianum DSM 120 TaxID=1150626 RepID=H8FY23_MAGML|nr:hypothetical protein [Magnetospirillum molischianum]CCG43261.1 hypothetical protein PHAMO_80052 [Magnetospirillum molischianum DSM 120]